VLLCGFFIFFKIKICFYLIIIKKKEFDFEEYKKSTQQHVDDATTEMQITNTETNTI